MSKYLQMFFDESQEHLEHIHQILDLLDKGETHTDIIGALFRHTHSLKGMASTMGFDRTAELSHLLEDRLSPMRNAPEQALPWSGLIRTVVERLEILVEEISKQGQESTEIQDMVDLLKKGPQDPEGGDSGAPPAAEAPGGGTPPPPPSDQQTQAGPEEPAGKPDSKEAEKEEDPGGTTAVTIRVTISAESGLPAARALVVMKAAQDAGILTGTDPEKDAILGGGFNGLLTLNMAETKDQEALVANLKGMPDVIRVEVEGGESQAKPQQVTHSGEKITTLRVGVEQIDGIIQEVEEALVLLNQLNDLMPTSDPRTLDRLLVSQKIANHMQSMYLTGRSMRLLPFETVTGRLARGFRETTKKLEKEAELIVEGQKELLDRSILEGLTDPLNHLLRNALDHGLEAPADRKRVGKDVKGKVRLRLERSGESLTVAVKDNGRGMDPEALARKALERGFITQERAQALSPQEKLQLITLPGFSTKQEVSDISGRGVGMDVVRDQVEALGGSLEINSKIGKGTTFWMIFPNTVNLINSMVFRDMDNLYAVPLNNIDRTIRGPEAIVQETIDGPVLLDEDEAIPILNMPWVMDMDLSGHDFVIIRREEEGSLAMPVPDIIGTETLLNRTMGKPLESMPTYLGAAIRGSGEVVLLVNPLGWIP